MILEKIKKFFKRNKGKGNPDAMITDEMRLKAIEVRRQNAQIRQLERQHESQKKLEILEEAITGVKKGNPLEEMFMKLIMTKLVEPKAPQQQGYVYGDIPLQPQQQQENRLDDNQINEAVKIIKQKLKKDDITFITAISDVDLITIKNKLSE